MEGQSKQSTTYLLGSGFYFKYSFVHRAIDLQIIRT